MPSQTSNLGLTIWNSASDWFDWTQLATNFQLIDAQFGQTTVISTPVQFIQSSTTLPSNPTNGQLFYLTSAASGFSANTLVQYINTTWQIVGQPELVSASPGSGNYTGRVVVFKSSSGSFNIGDIAVFNGSTYVKVGGGFMGTYSTVANAISAGPSSGNVAVLSAADNNLGAGGPYGAYSLVVYNASAGRFQPIAGVPAGAIEMFGGSSAPTGWLLCDGNTYNTTDYPNLFTAISYNYGGSGSTFSVPDMRGRVPVGVGTNSAVNGLNKSDGLIVGSRQPKHSHTVTDAGHTHSNSLTDPGHAHGGATGSTGFNNQGITSGTDAQVVLGSVLTGEVGSHTHTISSGSTGMSITNAASTTGVSVGSGSLTDTPSYITVYYIIKV